ncbi:hypothetical protein Tco_0333321 [Tanacetum coccineum]
MATLADKAILSGADNRLPMLEKEMYDSWKSIMEVYMLNRQHGRMILESIENDPLIWPSIEENGVTRPKRYYELSPTEAIQADCDIKATNIILQGLPPEVYALSPMYGSPYQSQQYSTHLSSTPLSITYPSNNYQSLVHHNMYSSSSSIPQLEYVPSVNQQSKFSQQGSGLIVIVFQKGDDPIDAINHMMSFLTAVVTSRYPTTNNQLRNSSNPRQQATINNGRVTLQPIQGRQTSLVAGTSRTYTPSGCRLLEVECCDPLSETEINQLVEYTFLILRNQRGHRELSSWNQKLLWWVMVIEITNVTNAIVIPDSEETLLLAEESRSKMLLKQKNPMMLEKKVNTTPIDYNSVSSFDPTPSDRPTNVEVPKELPKVSMVNTSLKKLKHHLAGFDVVVKERTTPIATIKDELSEVQNVFHKIEQAVEQHRLESKTFEVKMNQVLIENKRLLEKVISKDIVNILVDSSVNTDSVNVHECEKDNYVSNQSALSFDQLFELNELKAESQEKDTVIKKLKERIKSLSGKINEDKIKKDLEDIETINIELDHRVSKLIAENEHLKQTYKQLYDSIKPARIQNKEQCGGLINQVNLKSAEIYNLNARLQDQVLVTAVLKDDLRKIKGKAIVENAVTKHTIDPEMLKIDVDYLNHRLLNNRSAHSDYLKHTQEDAGILREIVKLGKSQNPLNESLDYALKSSTSASGSQPSGNTKKDKIRQTPSRTQKNKHSKLNANSELKCVKCNGCMLFDNHDLCVLDFINNVNAHAKSKSVKKSSKRKVWKPIGKMFTKIGYIWRPTGQTLPIVGNAKPRKSKTNIPVSKSKVPKSESANKKEPNQSWGSIVSNVPSSSLDECMSSKLFSGIWTPAAPSI